MHKHSRFNFNEEVYEIMITAGTYTLESEQGRYFYVHWFGY